MRKWIMAGIALLTVAISSCDEETLTLGDSLTENIDKFTAVSQSFPIETRSIRTDSVLTSSVNKFLGKLRDPETGTYITSDYMTQFNILENDASSLFPKADVMASKDDDGAIIADSCDIIVAIEAFQGDSLAAMKLTLQELDKPMPSSNKYYSNFDPEEEGYLRAAKNSDGTPSGAVKVNKVYTISDLTKTDSVRNVLRGTKYHQYIRIPLKAAYTDKNGVTYPGYDATKGTGSGYGTYLLRKYYENNTWFKDANSFKRNICPGFYVKSVDGQGVMIQVAYTQLVVYYRYTSNSKTVTSSKFFNSTEEVLQTTHITSDKESIKKLEAIDTCTFIKTPAGIFTEITLPVLKMKETDDNGVSHLNDSIVSAKMVFQRMKNTNDLSHYILEEPSQLLLVPRDNLYKFFEQSELPNNIQSYLATFNSTQKTYTFNNISNLVNDMYSKRNNGSENWNKAVLVPVSATYTTSGTSSTISAVSNEMGITSVRLVGGSNNNHKPVEITVIYNKNQ